MKGLLMVFFGLVLISAGIYGGLGSMIASLVYPAALDDVSGTSSSPSGPKQYPLITDNQSGVPGKAGKPF